MAAKLGSTDVSFRLGATTPAAVYLGSVEVWTAVTPRTLYFTGAVDSDWAELGNWFDDAEGTVAASSLPTAADSVIATWSIFSNSGDEPTVVDLTLNDASVGISITVTGDATFNDSAANSGTVTGDATFNDSSVNNGTVTGTATFNDSACNGGGTAGTFVPDPPPSCP